MKESKNIIHDSIAIIDKSSFLCIVMGAKAPT